jgi:anti-sigma factor RsiW
MTPTPSLDSLASTYLDGTISPEHLLLLEQMLFSDPDARRQFQRIANLDSGLREWAPICAAQSAWADAAPNAQPKPGHWQIWSAAAALVLTGLLTGFISGSRVSARVLSA